MQKKRYLSKHYKIYKKNIHELYDTYNNYKKMGKN